MTGSGAQHAIEIRDADLLAGSGRRIAAIAFMGAGLMLPLIDALVASRVTSGP